MHLTQQMPGNARFSPRLLPPARMRTARTLFFLALALGSLVPAPLFAATNETKAKSVASKAVASTVDPAAANATTNQLLPLGGGDVVNMQVFGRPELSVTAYIADDGTLAVPLAGNIAVAGLSPTAAAQKIAAAYKKGQILRNPQVTMLVTQSRSQLVSILGEVRSPGRFPMESRMTVIDALAQAGGTTERSGNVVYLMRANDTGEVERHAIDLRGLNDHRYSLKVLVLQGGDSIVVPPAEQFYIYGEVHAPNMYRLEPDMTVLQAISRSGGLTRAGSSSRIEIKRRSDGGQLLSHKATLDDRVQADDVIYVKESLF